MERHNLCFSYSSATLEYDVNRSGTSRPRRCLSACATPGAGQAGPDLCLGERMGSTATTLRLVSVGDDVG
jgi:hypothetical protein